MFYLEEKVDNMFKFFIPKCYSIVILAGTLYMLLHNVSLINQDNGFHIIPVNNVLKRKLYEINSVVNDIKISESLENVNDSVNNTENEIKLKVQEILSHNDNNFNLFKKYESIFSGLNNDEVYKTYELYLTDENVKSRFNNMKDIEYNKEIKELNEETLNKETLRHIWIDIKSNEEHKYFKMIRNIYNMLMHMKVKYKEVNIFTNDLWRECYSNYLSEKKNVEHFLNEMFNDWFLHSNIKLDEFKIIILGTKLIYRRLLNYIEKKNKGIIINAFKEKIKERKLPNSKIEEMYKIDFERKNEKKKNKMLNYYLKKRNYYPEMNDQIFINDDKYMTDVNYYLDGNKNEKKYIYDDVDETDEYDTKLLFDEKMNEDMIKTEEDIIKKIDEKVTEQYDEDNVSELGEDNVAKTIEDNVAKTIEDKVDKKIEDNVAKTVEDNVAKTVENKVAKTGKNKVAKTVENKAAKTGKNKVAKTIEDKVAKTGENYVKESGKPNVKEFKQKVEKMKIHEDKTKHYVKEKEDNKYDEKTMATIFDGTSSYTDSSSLFSDHSSTKDKNSHTYSSILEELPDAGETQGVISYVKDNDSVFKIQYLTNNRPIVYEQTKDAGETRFKVVKNKKHRKKKNIRKSLV
ncbi:exported protein (PHISTb) [Plasmodium gaboni]|uniref:Exported protein (PHISTb) n=1 Tax=Plasmodium gaboni TaxID=647221 RepID=A0A151LBI8_9APIC|nr:exported protein (PHISTb) [Plasmodium gaboni]KYN96344.1 exported protein (PHISTb) [Plasmodium gaboni]